MFQGLRQRTGLAYARFHFRKQKDAATRFSSALTRSQRALVVLPERPLDGTLIARVLEYLSGRFPSGDTVFVVRNELRSTLPPSLADRVQTYTPEDLTSFYTPRSALIRRFKSSTFDVAFDLNREFSLPSAFLCRASGAPLRVSFAKLHADAFFNFQVSTQEPSSHRAYERLMHCLDMF